jgi:hypothetical protein
MKRNTPAITAVHLLTSIQHFFYRQSPYQKRGAHMYSVVDVFGAFQLSKNSFSRNFQRQKCINEAEEDLKM